MKIFLDPHYMMPQVPTGCGYHTSMNVLVSWKMAQLHQRPPTSMQLQAYKESDAVIARVAGSKADKSHTTHEQTPPLLNPQSPPCYACPLELTPRHENVSTTMAQHGGLVVRPLLHCLLAQNKVGHPEGFGIFHDVQAVLEEHYARWQRDVPSRDTLRELCCGTVTLQGRKAMWMYVARGETARVCIQRTP
jgi:hypothetical protein